MCRRCAGGKTPIDDASLQGDFLTETADKFQKSSSDMEALNSAKKVSEIQDISAYDAIYIPGGHGVLSHFRFKARWCVHVCFTCVPSSPAVYVQTLERCIANLQNR